MARLSEAMNTYGPALTTLLRMGYSLRCEFDDREETVDCWIAESGEVRLTGFSPLTLLGLAALWRQHGARWREVGGSAIYDRLLDEAIVTPADVADVG